MSCAETQRPGVTCLLWANSEACGETMVTPERDTFCWALGWTGEHTLIAERGENQCGCEDL